MRPKLLSNRLPCTPTHHEPQPIWIRNLDDGDGDGDGDGDSGDGFQAGFWSLVVPSLAFALTLMRLVSGFAPMRRTVGARKTKRFMASAHLLSQVRRFFHATSSPASICRRAGNSLCWRPSVRAERVSRPPDQAAGGVPGWRVDGHHHARLGRQRVQNPRLAGGGRKQTRCRVHAARTVAAGLCR